jgi:hypothetical protein
MAVLFQRSEHAFVLLQFVGTGDGQIGVAGQFPVNGLTRIYLEDAAYSLTFRTPEPRLDT